MAAMSQQLEDRLLTLGELSRQLKAPIHRLDYLIRSRRLAPSGRAGIARVFDAGTREQLRELLGASSASSANKANGGGHV